MILGKIIKPNSIELGELEVIIDYYPNGGIKEITHFKNNKLHGINVEFFKDGMVSHINQFYNGVICDKQLMYHSSGNLYMLKDFNKKGIEINHCLFLEDNGELMLLCEFDKQERGRYINDYISYNRWFSYPPE